MPDPDDAELRAGLEAGDHRALARAITLVESTRDDHQARARALLATLLPRTGGAIRVGITGAPGVGKSTFVEALGLAVLAAGHRVAVLAVDPSSTVSGGSILGDKTRMERLAQAPGAFIRPSPARGALGGVAARTREAMLLCEAARHDVVLVETVGVGQSELAVAGMTDTFVLLQLPTAGDELQAIKKGIVELADLVVYNKVDLDPPAAERAMGQMRSALALLRPTTGRWRPSVRGISALRGDGVAEVWAEILAHRAALGDELTARRQQQAVAWLWAQVDDGLRARLRRDPAIRGQVDDVVAAVAAGRLEAGDGARTVLALL